MLESLSDKTKKQYNKSVKLWWEFCQEHQTPVFNSSTHNILLFFSEVLKVTSSYSTLNVYGAAISILMGNELSESADLSRFFKGVSRLRPQKPKYSTTWDPEPVLKYLETLDVNEKLSLEKITKKLAILLALTTAQRIQSISKIRLEDISTTSELMQIKISERIKTTANNRNQPVLHIPFFKEKPKICTASALQTYVERKSTLREIGRNSTNLFLT